MTVSYTLSVANSSSKFCSFGRLLSRWKASVYKIVWREILLFLVLFYVINLAHRALMSAEQRDAFEKFCIYCGQYIQRAPLTFVLAFYIGIVFRQWWDQFLCIAWPDRLAVWLAVYVRDIEPNDKKARMLRRSIIRYVNLSLVLALRMVSSPVKKRFPTLAHLVESGLMDEEELRMFEAVQSRDTKEYVPLSWACALLWRCTAEGHMNYERALLELLKEVNDFRGTIRRMLLNDWLGAIPLVYTQVVTIAVYSFFFATLFGTQRFSTIEIPKPPQSPAAAFVMEVTSSEERSADEQQGDAYQQYSVFEIDLYFPFFTVVEVLIYFGWLKVAEVLINPLGEDEDDFEINYIIGRNLEVSYIMADENYNAQPTLQPDKHWSIKRFGLLNTAASYGLLNHPFLGSTAGLRIPENQAEIVVSAAADDGDDVSSVAARSPTHKVSNHSGLYTYVPQRTFSLQSVARLADATGTVVRSFMRAFSTHRLSTRRLQTGTNEACSQVQDGTTLTTTSAGRNGFGDRLWKSLPVERRQKSRHAPRAVTFLDPNNDYEAKSCSNVDVSVENDDNQHPPPHPHDFDDYAASTISETALLKERKSETESQSTEPKHQPEINHEQINHSINITISG